MTSLTLVRRIKARPATVFAAVSAAEEIVHWFGPDEGPVLFAESDVRKGGRFRVRFRTLDGTEHEAFGEYVEVVDCERLVMTWQWAQGGDADERGGKSRLSIELRAIDTGTELTLTHAQLQNDVSSGAHTQGWSVALSKLERYLDSQAKRGSSR